MDMPRRPGRPTPGQRALADALARGEAALGEGVMTLSAGRYVERPTREAIPINAQEQLVVELYSK